MGTSLSGGHRRGCEARSSATGEEVRALTPAGLWKRVRGAIASRSAIRSPISNEAEIERLRNMPRYRATTTDLLGSTIGLADAASFLAQYQTIIREEQYRFGAARPDPRILDCGANIGLTSIYWKRLYPRARIVAFEPDPEVFKILSGNLDALGFTDVTRLPHAVWTGAGTLPFWAQGADGGRVLESRDRNSGPVRSIEAVRLRDYLDESTDLLKVDIEGAEVEVILDCADRLHGVENMIVEYHSFADRPQRLHELLNTIISAGFRVHVLPDVVSPRPFVEKVNNYGMDLQLNVFASRN